MNLTDPRDLGIAILGKKHVEVLGVLRDFEDGGRGTLIVGELDETEGEGSRSGRVVEVVVHRREELGNHGLDVNGARQRRARTTGHGRGCAWQQRVNQKRQRPWCHG